MDIETLKYPIGTFCKPDTITQENIDKWITEIQLFPNRLIDATSMLSKNQLDTPYRHEGWTIRQVVHHCADSHMNSFIRFKLALTEDKPTIKPYFEDRWAELIDTKNFDITPSIQIVKGVHARWVQLLSNLTNEDLKKIFIHPEHGKTFQLDEYIGFYAWHCNHHLAHINALKYKRGW
jgi:hypothetical protein